VKNGGKNPGLIGLLQLTGQSKFAIGFLTICLLPCHMLLPFMIESRVGMIPYMVWVSISQLFVDWPAKSVFMNKDMF